MSYNVYQSEVQAEQHAFKKVKNDESPHVEYSALINDMEIDENACLGRFVSVNDLKLFFGALLALNIYVHLFIRLIKTRLLSTHITIWNYKNDLSTDNLGNLIKTILAPIFCHLFSDQGAYSFFQFNWY